MRKAKVKKLGVYAIVVLAMLGVYVLFCNFVNMKFTPGASDIYLYGQPLKQYFDEHGKYPDDFAAIEMDSFDSRFELIANEDIWFDSDGKKQRVLV